MNNHLIPIRKSNNTNLKVHPHVLKQLIQVFCLFPEYENRFQTGENYIDCQKGKRVDEMNKVCRFDIDTLGEKCTWQQEYGYDEGQPCVVLKLNKVSRRKSE